MAIGFWAKVVGGAVLGVGAVAAAPFTGGGSLLGAASLASSLAGAGAIAAGAGAAGAAAGAVMGKNEEEERERDLANAKKRGSQESDARNALEMDKLKKEFADMMKDIATREQFLITAFAVGICAANADGEICEEEREELEWLVAGIGKSDVCSQETKNRLKVMYTTPPNLNEVWSLIEEHKLNDEKHIKMFTSIVEVVVMADSEKNDDEVEFIKAWNYKAA